MQIQAESGGARMVKMEMQAVSEGSERREGGENADLGGERVSEG